MTTTVTVKAFQTAIVTVTSVHESMTTKAFHTLRNGESKEFTVTDTTFVKVYEPKQRKS